MADESQKTHHPERLLTEREFIEGAAKCALKIIRDEDLPEQARLNIAFSIFADILREVGVYEPYGTIGGACQMCSQNLHACGNSKACWDTYSSCYKIYCRG